MDGDNDLDVIATGYDATIRIWNITTGENSLDINNFPSSEYILKVINKEELLIKSYKIVKY